MRGMCPLPHEVWKLEHLWHYKYPNPLISLLYEDEDLQSKAYIALSSYNRAVFKKRTGQSSKIGCRAQREPREYPIAD